MEVRVSRILSEYYGYTRREADALLQEGRVTLNGEIAASGDKASREDVVELDGGVIPLKGVFRTLSREKAQQQEAEKMAKARYAEAAYEDRRRNPKSKELRQGRKNKQKKRRGKNDGWVKEYE